MTKKMRLYHVYIIRTFKDREKEFCVPLRGISEEDVREYAEKEFIPEMKKGKTALCICLPNAVYRVDSIVIK